MFASLNTALTALQYNRVALDTAAGNVANVNTEGYVRRRVAGATVGAPSQPAMWSRYVGTGEGVRVASIDRLTDATLDSRVRNEHGNQSYLDTRKAVLDRVETGIGEPGPDGLATALSQLRSGWHDLANNPSTTAARSQLLSRAQGVVDAVAAQARNITTEAGDQRVKLQAMVSETNTVASDLATVNRTIGIARLNGSDTAALMDQRDQLALRLAELTGAKAVPGADGALDVSVNGVPLVTGSTAGQVSIATGVTASGDADGSPVTFAVTDGSGTTGVPGGLKGEAGATADLLSTTLPAYLSGLDAVARTLADDTNAQHLAGYDATGAPGTALFSYDPANPALSLAVAITDPQQVAASSVPGGGTDGGNADALGDLRTADDAYQKLVNGFGTEVASLTRLAANQQVLTDQVDGARDQLAGVNLDEETANLVAAQRAYEAASRVISTVDSLLDTLINRTGLVH